LQENQQLVYEFVIQEVFSEEESVSVQISLFDKGSRKLIF
jgi:hypothetical protein